MDFINDPDAIQEAFEDYYQTTILASETDPNKLHDLRGTVNGGVKVGHMGGLTAGLRPKPPNQANSKGFDMAISRAC